MVIYEDHMVKVIAGRDMTREEIKNIGQITLNRGQRDKTGKFDGLLDFHYDSDVVDHYIDNLHYVNVEVIDKKGIGYLQVDGHLWREFPGV